MVGVPCYDVSMNQGTSNLSPLPTFPGSEGRPLSQTEIVGFLNGEILRLKWRLRVAETIVATLEKELDARHKRAKTPAGAKLKKILVPPQVLPGLGFRLEGEDVL